MNYMLAGKSGLDYIYDHIATYSPLGRFDSGAYSTTRQVLAYCEGAMEAGVYETYKAEVQDDVDESIASIKETAKTLGVTFSTFRTRYMGNGVSEKELRRALELQLIASEYAEALTDGYLAELTTEDAEEYRDSHKEDFYTASYYSIDLYNRTLYNSVKDLETLDEVVLAVANYYFDSTYDEIYKKYFTTANVTDPDTEQTKKDIRTTVLAMNGIGDNEEVFTKDDTSGTDEYRKAARSVANGVKTATVNKNSTVQKEIEKITKRTDGTATDATYVDPTSGTAENWQQWLFAEERKADDFKSFTGISSSTATYTLYIVEDAMRWDTDTNLEHTKDLIYVQLVDDTEGDNKLTAQEKAELMYEALKDIKDKDEFAEKLEELLEQYQPDSTGSAAVQENVSESSLSDANLKAWAYNPLRKAGDLAILPLSEEQKKVEDDAAAAETETEAETEAESESETTAASGTTDSSSTATTQTIYLAFFVEENRATWEETGRDAIASEKLNDWFDAALIKYNVTVDYEFETESETAAA